MLSSYILLFFIIFVPTLSHGKFEFVDTYVGPSNFNRFIDTYQLDNYRNKNETEFRPALLGGIQFDYTRKMKQFFELGIVVPETQNDEHISKTIYFFITNFGYAMGDITLKVGLGMILTRISADGGVQPLRNGEETTKFPLPPRGRTARNLVTNLELEYFALSNWSAKISYQTYNMSDSETRQYGNMLSIVYHFWEKDWKFWKNK